MKIMDLNLLFAISFIIMITLNIIVTINPNLVFAKYNNGGSGRFTGSSSTNLGSDGSNTSNSGSSHNIQGYNIQSHNGNAYGGNGVPNIYNIFHEKNKNNDDNNE